MTGLLDTFARATANALARNYRSLVAGLIAIRVLMVLGIVYLDVPHVDLHTGWYFSHGGDELLYLTVTKGLLEGEVVPSMLPVGLPLFLMPLVAITGASSWSMVLSVAGPLTALVLGGGSVGFIAMIARKLLRSPAGGVVAALLWCLLPYLFLASTVPVFDVDQVIDVRYAEITALMWLQVTHTQFAVFFMLATVSLALSRYSNSPAGQIATGLLWGAAVLIRPEQLMLGLPIGIIFLLRKGLRSFAICYGAAMVAVLPQLVFNAAAFGSILTTGYSSLWHRAYDVPAFSLAYIAPVLEDFGRRYALLVPSSTLAMLAVVGRRYWSYRDELLIAVAWLLPFTAVYMSFHSTRFAPLARLMPALVPWVILGTAGFMALVRMSRPRAS